MERKVCCFGKKPSLSETSEENNSDRRLSARRPSNNEYYEFIDCQNKAKYQSRSRSGSRSGSIMEDEEGMSSMVLNRDESLHSLHSTVPGIAHLVISEFYKYEPLKRAGEWKPYVNGDFNTIRLNIARGTTCKIHLVQHKKSRMVGVMKVLNPNFAQSSAEYEIHTIARDSPFLLKALAAYTSEDKHFILLEYAPFRTLDNLTQTLKGIGSDRSRIYAAEILCALEFLHSRNIIHRDVKPQNMFLLSSGHAVLGDFGSAHQVKDNSPLPSGLCGTYVTRPPEVWHKEPYDYSIDIWMFGVSVYNLISNKWPFLHPFVEKQISMVEKCKMIFPLEFSHVAADFVTMMVQVPPSLRPSASELMEHHYFLHLKEPYSPPYTPEQLYGIIKNTEDKEFIIFD